MNRTKLTIIAACGLVGLGATALYRFLAEDPSEPSSATGAKPEPAREPAPPAAQAPTAAPAPAGPAAAAARKEAPEDAPYPKDVTELLKALQPMQAEVAAELTALDEHSRCHFHRVIVQLTLESGRGEVLIKDVVVKPRPVEGEQNAEASAAAAEQVVDEADARCVREAMEGKTLPAQSARKGRRWQQWYWPSPRPR